MVSSTYSASEFPSSGQEEIKNEGRPFLPLLAAGADSGAADMWGNGGSGSLDGRALSDGHGAKVRILANDHYVTQEAEAASAMSIAILAFGCVHA